MRHIKIVDWEVTHPEGKKVNENLLAVLSILVSNQPPEKQTKGFDQFKLFGKLVKAFEKAEETKELVLEEPEYKYLKQVVVDNIPAQWGANKNIAEAVEAFINAKEE